MTDDNRPPRYKAAKTPIRGVSMWDDDQRAQIGAEHRRIDRSRSSPGIDLPPDLPRTGIEDALRNLELTSPSPLVMSDPVAMELWERIDRYMLRIEGNRRQTADHVMEIKASHGGQAIEQIRSDVDGLKRVVRWLIGLLIAALTAAGGSLVAVGRGLYDRGAHEGGDAVRLDHVERAIDRISNDMRDVRNLFERASPHSSLTPAELHEPGDNSLTALQGPQ